MELLDRARYPWLRDVIAEVPFNTLYARAVLTGDADGWVYVDGQAAASYYVVNVYGMTLLGGEAGDPAYAAALVAYLGGDRGGWVSDQWLQAHPREWDDVLAPLVTAGRAERLERVNFAFDEAVYHRVRRAPVALPVRPTPPDRLWSLPGDVVPTLFWRDRVTAPCTSFSVMDGDVPVAIAFTSFRTPTQLEMGIETLPAYRGRGYAQAACAALIDYCLAEGLEPVWSCRDANHASIALANRLGFRESHRLPYYHFPRGGPAHGGPPAVGTSAATEC